MTEPRPLHDLDRSGTPDFLKMPCRPEQREDEESAPDG